MKKRFLINLINLIAFTFAILILVWIQVDKLNFSIQMVILATFVNAVLLRFYIELVKTTFTKTIWENSYRVLLLRGEIKPLESVRTSFSQLYRIRVDGKYFLVKANTSGLYQSPATTYENKDYVRDKVTKAVKMQPESNYAYNNNQFKYRLFAKEIGALIKSVNKFYNKIYVENYAKTYFYSTLEYYGVSFKVVNSNNSSILYRGRYIPKIDFSRREQRFEVFIHDIFELILDSKTEEELKKFILNKDNYILATEHQINRLGTNSDEKQYTQYISEFTERILEINEEYMFYPR
jgi:hypothetical protein